MTNAEFEKEVREMRRFQKLYFKNRQADALRYAKDYERRVDAELQRRSESVPSRQGSLL